MLGIGIYFKIKHVALNANLKDDFAAVTTPNWQWKKKGMKTKESQNI